MRKCVLTAMLVVSAYGCSRGGDANSGGNTGGSVASGGSGVAGTSTGGGSPGGTNASPGGGVPGGSGSGNMSGTGGTGGESTGGGSNLGGGTAGSAGDGGTGGGVSAGLGPAGNTCPAGPYAAPLAGDTKATLVKGNLGGELEGPVWVESLQALLFTQSGGGNANGKINKYTPQDDMLTTFVDHVGVGGLAMDTGGQILAASYDKRTITRFDPATAKRSDVPGGDAYNGQPFNEVNDVVMRGDGNIYFSDPQYDSVPPGEQPMAFYRLSPPPASKVTLVLAAEGANGIALSPDGKWLYLGTTESGGGPVRRLALADDGAPSGEPTTWKEGSSDGMAMDCAGNLYITIDNQVRVLSPKDEVLGSITGLGNGYVTNSAFGDADHQTLYITTNTSLFKVHLGVPGFPN
ncbi:MAG TPA: SMP-30/gluconolactonase/LRE family protein [Polyangiaceae bacterium]|nr:SMP-30/gluconolactonase/LRE family protein [Polyangiaceae bacterium]